MQTGPRVLGSASLNVRVSVALPARMRDRTREITKLQTAADSQHTGEAGRLMEQVCDEADTHGITLVLWPRPFGDIALSEAQLIAWYARRFGFVQIQPDPPMMARMPNSTPRYLTPVATGVAFYG